MIGHAMSAVTLIGGGLAMFIFGMWTMFTILQAGDDD